MPFKSVRYQLRLWLKHLFEKISHVYVLICLNIIADHWISVLKLSRWQLSRQHLSWRHLSISGISHLLLIRFWLNFKGRFLGPSLTDANCRSDIFTGNICPSDICPYQEYLSCCLPYFDQTLKVGCWDANCHGKICPGNICPANICPCQEYLSCY